MKKLFTLVLVALSALALYSCDTSPKSYSYYFIGADHWQGADTTTYSEVANLLVRYGYLNSQTGFTIEGENISDNDTQALNRYNSYTQAINDKRAEIEEQLKGKGTDGKAYSVQFVYSLNRGETQWHLLKDAVMTINVPAQ